MKPTATGRGKPTPKQRLQLTSSYRECLNVAKQEGSILSIAFCCISTGVFGYPQVNIYQIWEELTIVFLAQDEAAEVAMETVNEWLSEGDNADHFDLVLFNVFTNTDLHIYEEIFPRHFPARKEEATPPSSQEEAP